MTPTPTSTPEPSQVSFTKVPRSFQLYPRDRITTNQAAVPIEGTVAEPIVDAIQVDVYRDSALLTALTQTLTFAGGSASFSFAPIITAELVNYDFQISLVTNGVPSLIQQIDKVVAGDIFVIDGQSNAQAHAFNGSANFNQSEFIRSYGTSSFIGSEVEANQEWVMAEGDVIFTVGSVGQWGLRFGRLFIDEQNIPIAILNEAHDGTPISYHQRNDADPDD